MRFVLHKFCGMPLWSGAFLIGLFTSVVACVALGSIIASLLNPQNWKHSNREIFITDEEWLNYMSQLASTVFLLAVVCFMQLWGASEESPVLQIPFVVVSIFLVCWILTDQIVSALLGIGNAMEVRGVIPPAVTLLIFVWIVVSYITELRQKNDESKLAVLQP